MTDNCNQVRVRFAPSPTGSLHVGGARTALFNALFARHTGGKLILRIEDTDLERSTPEAVETILKGLDWLDIKGDEGPFYQTQRFEIYRDYARRLLELGHAYPCTCTAAQLDTVREAQRARGEKPQYNRLHRPAEIAPQPARLPGKGDAEPFVIRLRAPLSGTCVFDDLILGQIETPFEEIDDFVIVRSDGSPTYNFTVVVDDIEMRISHVIRGMDHVSNTPKQLVIYDALEAKPPLFAHVPMILGADKKKLSKRHGATSVFEYKSEGYLSEAFVNYIARLGWGHGDQEIFTRTELEEYFTLEAINKSPAVFDTTKLQWVNAEHMKTRSGAELAPLVGEFLAAQGFRAAGRLHDPAFHKLLDGLKERKKTLVELAEGCRWFFLADDQIELDQKAAKKFLVPAITPALTKLIERIGQAQLYGE
ncbi:MAG TPA: glutamate--tRNA ligase, partial [Oligoflexia bacterium]|nr:glutamate--tRNA ligase [Oligoflexia bacterium]